MSAISYRRIWNLITDSIWPHLMGEAPSPPGYRAYFNGQQMQFLDEANRILSLRSRQMEERLRNVEQKLVAVFALTSVLSLVLTAAMTAAATFGSFVVYAKIATWLAVILVFYLAVQLLRSLWATVSGLSRRKYKQLTPMSIVPEAGETTSMHRVRLLNAQLNFMSWNEWVVDGKVSELALAHAAIRNALIASFVLVALSLAIVSLSLCRASDAM